MFRYGRRSSVRFRLDRRRCSRAWCAPGCFAILVLCRKVDWRGLPGFSRHHATAVQGDARRCAAASAGEHRVAAFGLFEELPRRCDQPQGLLVLFGILAAVHRAGSPAAPPICHAVAGVHRDRFLGDVRLCLARVAGRAHAQAVRFALARPYVRCRSFDTCGFARTLSAR
jgi:hypothetical protein